MKRRVRKIANFFAFNLLFFALYLNFIHKDKPTIPSDNGNAQHTAAAFSGTVLVDNPSEYAVKAQEATSTVSTTSAVKNENSSTALKLSIN